MLVLEVHFIIAALFSADIVVVYSFVVVVVVWCVCLLVGADRIARVL